HSKRTGDSAPNATDCFSVASTAPTTERNSAALPATYTAPLATTLSSHMTLKNVSLKKDWRFCTKCNGLFFSGVNGTYYREKQRCPAGDLHSPAGYNFVLSHDIEERFTQKGLAILHQMQRTVFQWRHRHLLPR